MVVSWLCFIILYIFSTLHYQKVQNKGKFKHFPKHNLLWLLYFSEASFSLFSVGKLGHIDFANVIYWVNREVGLEPNIQTSPYMFCCFLLFVCLFFNHSAHLPPWGNQDGLWRLNTHMAMANWGDSSWSLTCCIFKGLLTWVIERGSSCYTQDTAQSHYSDEPLRCPPFLGCGSTKSSLLWIGQESKEL